MRLQAHILLCATLLLLRTPMLQYIDIATPGDGVRLIVIAVDQIEATEALG